MTKQERAWRKTLAEVRRQQAVTMRKTLVELQKVIRREELRYRREQARKKTLMRPVIAMWKKLDPAAARRREKPWLMAKDTATKVIWLASRACKRESRVGGRVIQCHPWLAAQCIVNDTHRLARPKEIATWEKEQTQRWASALHAAAGATL